MSAVDLAQDTELQREPVKEPAKRWRNWWRFSIPVQVKKSGQVFEPGDHPGPSVFPSREIAEQRALEKLRGDLTYEDGTTTPFADNVFYLGAFPEGEKPHV